MADKKITELDTLTYATAAPGDLFVIEDIDGSETKAITAENLGKYVLGNRTIGGTTAGDIVTIDGTQTLKNKTITSPKLNEDVAVTSSATEVNVLDGIDAALTAADLSLLKGLAAAGLTNAELGYVNGVTSGIQAQLNALWTVAGTTARTFTYAEEWSDNAAASKTITRPQSTQPGRFRAGITLTIQALSALYTQGTETPIRKSILTEAPLSNLPAKMSAAVCRAWIRLF